MNPKYKRHDETLIAYATWAMMYAWACKKGWT